MRERERDRQTDKRIRPNNKWLIKVFWLNGISTFDGYLMQNPVHTYIIYDSKDDNEPIERYIDIKIDREIDR